MQEHEESETPDPEPMSPIEIIAAFADARPGVFPEAALAAAQDQQEIMIRLLNAALDDCFNSADEGVLQEKGDWRLPFFGFYLLTHWKAPSAHYQLVRALRLSAEDLEWLLGDGLTTDWPSLLTASFTGDPGLLKAVVLDEDLYEYARSSALQAIASLAHRGTIDRAETEAWFADLFSTLDPAESFVWNTLAISAADLHMVDLLPQIHRAFAAGSIDETVISPADAEKIIRGEDPWPDVGQPYLPDFVEPIEDIPGWLRDFAYFADPSAIEENGDAEDLCLEAFGGPSLLPPTPARRQTATEHISAPTIGRNDPCPCGSGKKYKKCCGAVS